KSCNQTDSEYIRVPVHSARCLLRAQVVGSEPCFFVGGLSKRLCTFSSLKTFPTSVTECDSKMLSADGQGLARHLLAPGFCFPFRPSTLFYNHSYGLSFSPAAWAFLLCRYSDAGSC